MNRPGQQILFIFAGFFFLTCHATLQVCLIGEEHKEYDDSHHICCNGEIKMRVRDQECCGGKFLYFTSVSICCGGNVEDRFVVPKGSRLRDCSVNDEQCREQMCCGSQVVDQEGTMCCQHNTVYLNHTQQLEKYSWQCCGTNVINTASHFCCGARMYVANALSDCCDGEVFDKSAEKCLTSFKPNVVVKKYQGVCGNVNKIYDRRFSSCCNGVLHSMPEMDPLNPSVRNPSFSCCDSIVYDSSKEQCCRESRTGFKTHTIPRQPNIYCCGEDFYNATHEGCYKGKKLKKVSGKVQCGYGYIDDISEKCCANMVYSQESQDCCTGKTFNVISKDQTCCNGEGIDENMLCCDGIASCIKTSADDDECCYNHKSRQARSYNSKDNKFCVDGEVIHLPQNAEPCGVANFYYRETQICCGETIYDIGKGYDDCCDDKPYNSETQQCCNYEISNISPKEGSCCSRDFRVYRFNDTKNPCRKLCGNISYDDTYQGCCQGIVHDLIGNKDECCGSSTINSYSTECCGGQFPLSRTGSMKCCGDRDLYNEKHSICRKNKIVPQDLSLRKLSDVQHLCTRTALKYFDGGIQYACKSHHAVKAKVERVMVTRVTSNITYIRMSFYDVVGLDRGENFTMFQGSQKLTIHVEVPDSGLTCRKSYITRYCRVLIFFSGKVRDGSVKISRKSRFFMTSYTPKKESFITKSLSHQFCRTKFSIK